MTAARVTQATLEVLTAGSPKALATHAFAEALVAGTPKACATHLLLEVLAPVGGGVSSGSQQPVVVIMT